MIFETHAHYDDKMFDEDRESLLGSMQEAGIGRQSPDKAEGFCP